jgi:hypothetical protein
MPELPEVRAFWHRFMTDAKPHWKASDQSLMKGTAALLLALEFHFSSLRAGLLCVYPSTFSTSTTVHPQGNLTHETIGGYSGEMDGSKVWLGDRGASSHDLSRAEQSGIAHLVTGTRLGEVFAMCRGKELAVCAGQVRLVLHILSACLTLNNHTLAHSAYQALSRGQYTADGAPTFSGYHVWRRAWHQQGEGRAFTLSPHPQTSARSRLQTPWSEGMPYPESISGYNLSRA